ncbi:MAG TPA: hypothetical protein VGN63_09480 [Flavisolibacter sp.]|jgi:hypothetical protein|nr:hypothetical protein [Flavisolibacter sp.]
MRKNAFQKKIISAGVRIKQLTLCSFLLAGSVSYSQEKDPVLSDTTFYDYDEIFNELDLLIDSLYTPRSFVVANVSAGNGFFQYAATTANAKIAARQQMVVSPAIGFFHKSGLGINAGASIINDSSRLQPFQFSLTGSYDYLKSMKFITGVSYTRFFTKDDLRFYTSPLQNEVYGYFTYRSHWLKPSLAASYGWGSRSDVQEQTVFFKQILEKVANGQGLGNGNGNNGNGNGNNGNGNNGNGNGNGNNGNGNNGNNNGNGNNGGIIVDGSETTVTTTHETVADLSLMLSVRHDFYFLKLLSQKDYVRLTPQLTFTSGTQQFGFNALSNSYLTVADRSKNINVITGQQDIALENRMHFQPLSLTAQLRTEYTTGKFFIQPQVFVDYYFPAPEKNLTASFLINTGFIF